MADETNCTDSLSEQERQQIPKPYRTYNHPHLSWTEVFVTNFFHYFITSFRKLVSHEPTSEETKKELEVARKQMHDVSHGMMGKLAIKKWADVSQCPIAEYAGVIPFQESILLDWEILQSDGYQSITLPEAASKRDSVKVLVRFPSTLMSPTFRETAEKLEYSGCLNVAELDLKNFAKDVPVLIKFHGGGLTMGGPHKTELINDAAGLIAVLAEQRKADPPPDLITVCVEYGLAPEHPFPIGIMDALSVVDFFLADNADRKLHISGESAGANISLVAGLEGHRRYPGRIVTIQAQSPMIDPAGDSMSYFMNQNVFPDMGWLRWCWRAYLDLPKPEPNPQPETINDALRSGSNHVAWQDWKSKNPVQLQRLVNPACDIPAGLTKEKGPHIIASVNLADPLLDDGAQVAVALQEAGANVTFLVHTGIHCDIGGDRVEAFTKRLSLWSASLFGSK